MVIGGDGAIAITGYHHCSSYSAPERYLHALYVADDGETWVERLHQTSSSSNHWLHTGTVAFSRASDMVLYQYGNTISSTMPLRVSRDGGASWSEYTSPMNHLTSSLVLSDTLPNALMARRSSDWYVTHDYGETWTSTGVLGGSVSQRGGQAFAYGRGLSGGGILTTTDFFQNVERMEGAGLTTGAGPRSVVPRQDASHLRSHGEQWRSDLLGLLSTDRGVTWTATDTPSRFAAQSPTDPNRWYFATSKGDVYRSSDNANAYSYAGTLQNYAIPSVLAPSHSNRDLVYALTNGGVYRSDDAAATWTWASTNLTTTGLSDLIVDPTDHDTLYVGGGFGVHKSTDGGDDWRLANTGLTNDWIVRLAITSDGATLFAAAESGSVYRSLDAGGTWEWVNDGFESYRVTDLVVDPNDDNVVYAATIGGVYKSTDKGSSWTLASAGMYSPFVTWLAMAQDSNTLYAGTQDHGIYRGTPTNDTGAAFPTSALANVDQVMRAINSREGGH